MLVILFNFMLMVSMSLFCCVICQHYHFNQGCHNCYFLKGKAVVCCKLKELELFMFFSNSFCDLSVFY